MIDSHLKFKANLSIKTDPFSSADRLSLDRVFRNEPSTRGLPSRSTKVGRSGPYLAPSGTGGLLNNRCMLFFSLRVIGIHHFFGCLGCGGRMKSKLGSFCQVSMGRDCRSALSADVEAYRLNLGWWLSELSSPYSDNHNTLPATRGGREEEVLHLCLINVL